MNSERKFVTQLRAGETIDQVFLVREKDLRTAKNGGQYITFTLCDRTGSVPAIMWQATEGIYKAVPVDGFLHVKGRTEEYRGATQLIIDACRPWPADKLDLSDFVPMTEMDIEQMWAELLEILRAVKDQPLRMLIKKFAEDREFVAAFKKAPGAMQLHHAFIGGLLEHTLQMAKVCVAVLPLYPQLNADLVLAGVFLHDAGKTRELSVSTAVAYTDRGQLVGHIVEGVLMIHAKAEALSAETGEAFPQRTLDLLEHLILAHHGEYEYGSPRLPAIPEAFLLHHVDNLDAKLFMTLRAVANDPDPAATFTPFLKQIQTRVYKRSGDLT